MNLQDEYGETALSAACRYGQICNMENLLRHGANTSLEDRCGQTVLHEAAVDSPEGV